MGWRLGLWMRTATEAAIFRKVLRMPLFAFAESGEEAVPRAGAAAGTTTSSSTSGGGKRQGQQSPAHLEEEGDGEEDSLDGLKDEAAAVGEEEEEEDDAYHQSITPGLIMNMATTDVDR
jgi:hypothetical protein